ncbi:unnamed protein product [Mytilus coruscus]|uniref:Uncharacterized protein n=1 Tax=Mytilus coruscus TaxID=42192 RepID=A0A6J8C1A2_MYTCO|nr:unnamed protein product [Mytilus coruscus]
MSKRNRHFKRTDKNRKSTARKTQSKIKNKKRRHKKKVFIRRKAENYVKMFTREKLSDSDINILSKGLKFIPSPVLKRAKNDLLCDWENLSRRMRLNYSFRNTENSSEKHPFKRKSEFTPEFANNAIETYLWKTKVELERLPMVNSRNNLTKNEFNSLISLKKNENIIIKKADKYSTIEVLDKHMYIKQAMTQLSSEIHYHKLSETHSQDIYNKIIEIIIPLHNMGHIDKHSLDCLTSGKEFKPVENDIQNWEACLNLEYELTKL